MTISPQSYGDSPEPLPGVAARLDALPLTRLHLGAVALCALGLFADIAEVALSNVLAAVFTAPPSNLTRSDLSLLLASVFAGGAIGAPVLGWLADRFGRRIVMQGALATIAVSSLGAAASPSIEALTVWRFISGLAIGAYPPLTAAFLSDLLPPKRRGLLLMICAGLAFLGAPAVILLVRSLSPALGMEAWRWGVAAGGLVAGLSAALFALLPESPRWLATCGRPAEADRACRRFEASAGLARRGRAPTPSLSRSDACETATELTVPPPAHLRRMAFLACLYLLGPWATLGFPLLSAAVMVRSGFTLSESVLFAGLSMVGPSLGILAVAPWIDRLDRRAALVLCAAVMVGLCVAFPFGSSLTPLVAMGIAFNLVSAVYSAVLALYAAELFSTARRASASASAWGLGRLISIAVPIVLVALMTGYGPAAIFVAMAIAMLLSLGLIAVAGPVGTPGRPVH